MATAPFAGSYPAAFPQSFGSQLTQPLSARTRTAAHIIRRRPTREQGRSLEILGHAIEYLIDSQLYAGKDSAAEAVVEAEQILMRLNREVFSECVEVAPRAARLAIWLRRLASNAAR